MANFVDENIIVQSLNQRPQVLNVLESLIHTHAFSDEQRMFIYFNSLRCDVHIERRHGKRRMDMYI